MQPLRGVSLPSVWMDGFGLGEGLYLLLGLLDHQVTVKEDLQASPTGFKAAAARSCNGSTQLR